MTNVGSAGRQHPRLLELHTAAHALFTTMGTRLGALLALGLFSSQAKIVFAQDGHAVEEATHAATEAAHAAAGHGSLAASLPWYTVVPFVLLLLSIAVLPLVAHHWWEQLRNRAIVSFGLSLPIAIALWGPGRHELLHSMYEYVAFIALLGSLFVVSGGIVLSGDLRATPRINTAFLAVGAILANFIGTTGASMLLIRPFLKTNSERNNIKHLPIFFIFVVSNIGGCLTPLGDPPLFLGYLRGVPFTWTLHLLPEWLVMIGLLLAVFYVWDTVQVKKETAAAMRADVERVNPLELRGKRNLILVLGIIGSVFIPMPWRALAMFAIAVISYKMTPRHLHLANRFTFFPINEVAILFAGIFVTVVPALVLLEANGEALGVEHPWQFFWLTGLLSSFLDNAPTYLTFTSLGLGVLGLPGGGPDSLLHLVQHPEGVEILKAISLGAVFMGANTYIGNAPNFMVKSICEERRLSMPSFFGYMGWSALILFPLFAIVTLIFLL